MKTMSVGLIGTPEQAEEIIASGKADFVVIGRTALYDPRWAWHAAEALGVETDYAPKYRMAQPAIRPELFPNHRKASYGSRMVSHPKSATEGRVTERGDKIGKASWRERVS